MFSFNLAIHLTHQHLSPSPLPSSYTAPLYNSASTCNLCAQIDASMLRAPHVYLVQPLEHHASIRLLLLISKHPQPLIRAHANRTQKKYLTLWLYRVEKPRFCENVCFCAPPPSCMHFRCG